jgi:prevent-host-death family protein
MLRVTLSEARDNLSDFVNKVKYNHERIIVQKHGKEAAAIINIEELKLLEALIERYENEIDIQEVERIMGEEKHEDFVAWEDVKARLGLE